MKHFFSMLTEPVDDEITSNQFGLVAICIIKTFAQKRCVKFK
jgi:hypothetical protein